MTLFASPEAFITSIIYDYLTKKHGEACEDRVFQHALYTEAAQIAEALANANAIATTLYTPEDIEKLGKGAIVYDADKFLLSASADPDDGERWYASGTSGIEYRDSDIKVPAILLGINADIDHPES